MAPDTVTVTELVKVVLFGPVTVSVSLLVAVGFSAAQTNVTGCPAWIEGFIIYGQRHPGVVFLRKDEITRFSLASPATIREGETA